MQVFKFNAATRSVGRAVADAIGQGIAQEIAARREHNDSRPQRFAQLIARLDDADRARSQNSHDLVWRQSREPADDERS